MAEQIVNAPAARGSVLDQGAHVLSWVPEGHRPVIWLSKRALFEKGVAVRGGVPICFPWFGSGPQGNLAPAHGFARISDWRLVSVDEHPDGTTVVHALDEQRATSPKFPHPYRAVSSVTFADTLRHSLEVTNSGTTAFDFEAALHAYLAVGDSTAIRVEGLSGDSYLDKVDKETRMQVGPVTIQGEVDRVYTSDAAVRVVDPVLGRAITVEKSGSASTVVWNPWVDKARRLADFGDDEWRTMVCVETANVAPAAVHLEPGESHTMTARITVERT